LDQTHNFLKSVTIQNIAKTPKAMTVQEAEATRRQSILHSMEGISFDQHNFEGY